jgi:Ca2+-binding RTX toxin-like protein
MRFTHLFAAVPATAAIATLAFGAAAAAAAPPSLPTVPPTLPKKCAKDGVCFVKTFKGATITMHVTGTAGNDKIVVTNIAAFGNNSLSTIGINGIKTGVSATSNARFVIRGLAGNDEISMPNMNGVNTSLYGTATVDGGDGNDVILTAKAPDVLIGGAGADVLDGGAGNDQLFAVDGAADSVRGGLGLDAAESDALDTLDAVEAPL